MTTAPTIRILEVGGFVRDEILGIPSKDRDCTVVIEGAATMSVETAFDIMRDHLTDRGFTIFVETPEHGTIRALPPKDGSFGRLPADFVLARREGPYSDGRRPDWVLPGTLADDLNRRDFTVNAIARDVLTREVIDLNGGLLDLASMTLRFVGDPAQRIREDALRVMRGIRFNVTRGFKWDHHSRVALFAPEVPALLAAISEERRENELRSMFDRANSVVVLQRLAVLPTDLVEAMFAGRVRLTSTLRK